MKALALHEAGSAGIIDVEKPEPREGELLLKVEMVGLCGTDLNSFRGMNPLITFPRVIGHEIAATVEKGTAAIPQGERVTVSPYTSCGVCTSCKAGRENACRNNQTYGVQRHGAMTEWLAVPENKVFASKLPLKHLCLVEPLTVGFHAVARGRVTAEDTVVVFGCGGIGLGAIAGAAFRGARTIAIDVDERKLEIARLAGATDTIHSGKQNVAETLAEMTNGDGPNVVIEAIGLAETFRLAVELVAFAGRVVYIGYAKQPVAYETKLFVQKELDIMGSRNALPADFREVIRMLEAGRFPVEEAVSLVVPLEGAAEALAKWSESPASFTKIMVQVS